jgi:hypothetical protein
VLTLLGLGAAAIAVAVIAANSDQLLTALDTLTSVSVGWAALALAAEAVSYLARGAAQDVVLRRAGLRLGPLVHGAAVMAGDAAAYCLPFGFAASGVVMVGVLRRRRVTAAVAGWMFAVSSVFYVGAVGVLTIVAVQVAGDADPVPGLRPATLTLLGVLVAAGLGYGLLRQNAVRRALSRPLARRSGRAEGPGTTEGAGARARFLAGPRARVDGWLAQLTSVRLSWSAAAWAFGLMLLSWVTDIAVLAIAYPALGADPPWAGLLLAYCAGQVAASVPVTPGGIGVVEGSLTLALVAFGGSAAITLAAVLLYRIITYWACIPLGALSWLALRATGPGRRDADDADNTDRPGGEES